MNKSDLRAIIDGVTGDPESGAVAAVVPAIVDALDAALNPTPSPREDRVVKAAETR